MRVCSSSMPSCSKKRASSLFTTACTSQMEMRLSGTQCWFRRATRPSALASFIRASINAVVVGLPCRNGSTEGSVPQKRAPRQAVLPNLVTEKDYPLAATLENSLWAVTLATGSALGGIVLALVGRDAAFLCDAASFLGSAALIARLPPGRAKRADKQAIEVLEEGRAPGALVPNLLGLRDLKEGVRYVASHRR